MTVIDPAFEGAGQTPGLTIWRIEKMEVKPIAEQHFGSFFTGDSYIVLKTIQSSGGSLSWNIHFWLGSKTSQDEAGTAAIKTVELDEMLGGSPVQHREVQDHESMLFLSYFKKGIRYLEGGVASGFRHVEEDATRRLLHVKGRRNVRVREVPPAAGSMNHGDCFILDAGDKVLVWFGQHSGRHERLRAVQAANAVRDDLHGGRSVVQIIDSDSTASEQEEFFATLGDGTLDDVCEGSKGAEEDVNYEKSVKTRLFKIWNDEEGNINEEEVNAQPMTRQLLDSESCFLLDAGLSGIFVWVGKQADQRERSASMSLAQKYLAKKDLPSWVNVSRVIEDAEPPMFKQFFSSWTSPETSFSLQRLAAAVPQVEIPVDKAKRRHLEKNLGSACGFMPDDGSGQTEIWRIENLEIVPIDEATHGMFFGGDCYIVKYQTLKNNYILYFWQGKESSLDERAASAMWTLKLDNDLCGKAIQVRVVHGFEPEHFLRIFKGQMVILMGGKASGFRNRADEDTEDRDGTRLFQVRGTSAVNTRAEQVPEKAEYLDSDDVFVLEIPSKVFVWAGKGATAEEIEFAKGMVPRVAPNRPVDFFNEGDETQEFWEALGGQGEYSHSRQDFARPLLEPRLFKCSDSSGTLLVEEICSFDMEDLCEDDVMLLDSGDEIYIWIGKAASEEEKKGSLKIAEDFLTRDMSGRSPDNTPVVVIKQGREPTGFTSLFSSWDPSVWQTSTQL